MKFNGLAGLWANHIRSIGCVVLIGALLIIQSNQVLSDTGAKSLSVSGTGNKQELVVIGTEIDEAEFLVTGLSVNEAVNYHVIYLNSEVNGFQQIANYLADQGQFDALHLITHGKHGQIQIGNEWVSSDSLAIYQTSLSKLQQHLSLDADLLIYACNLASTKSGRTLVNKLAELTKADVSASTNATGSEQRGGDWLLEYQYGEIDTSILSSNSWKGVLDPELTVTKVDSADPVPQNTNFTYTMVVTNIHSGGNNSNNAENVVLTDVLPAGMLYQSHTVSASGTPGSCTPPAVGTNGTVTCSLGTIRRNNNNATVSITVTPTLSGTFTNTADITSSNAAAVTVDEDTTITAVGGTADLIIEKAIINDNSGTAVVADFNILTSAGALTFGAPVTGVYTSNTLTIAAGTYTGTYTLIEDDLAGYNEGSWSCTDGTGLVSHY